MPRVMHADRLLPMQHAAPHHVSDTQMERPIALVLYIQLEGTPTGAVDT